MEKVKRKGQMFIIGAIIIIIGLVMLRGMYSMYEVSAESLFQDSASSAHGMVNLAGEYSHLAVQNYSIAQFSGFSGYLRDSIPGVKIFFVFAKPVPGGYDIYAGNFLGYKINATVISGESYGLGVLGDREVKSQSIGDVGFIEFIYGDDREKLLLENDEAVFYDITLEKEFGIEKQFFRQKGTGGVSH